MGQQRKVQGYDERNTEKGPRDVVDVSWAIGEFFYIFIYILLTVFFLQMGCEMAHAAPYDEEKGKRGPKTRRSVLGCR